MNQYERPGHTPLSPSESGEITTTEAGVVFGTAESDSKKKLLLKFGRPGVERNTPPTEKEDRGHEIAREIASECLSEFFNEYQELTDRDPVSTLLGVVARFGRVNLAMLHGALGVIDEVQGEQVQRQCQALVDLRVLSQDESGFYAWRLPL